jgi:hypothetical protein
MEFTKNLKLYLYEIKGQVKWLLCANEVLKSETELLTNSESLTNDKILIRKLGR